MFSRSTPRGGNFISAISVFYALAMTVICLSMLLAKVIGGGTTIGSKSTDVSMSSTFTIVSTMQCS